MKDMCRSDSQVPGGLPVNLAVIVHGPAEAVDLVRFISISATRQKKRQLSEYDGQNYD